jgi:hypothetical protein
VILSNRDRLLSGRISEKCQCLEGRTLALALLLLLVPHQALSDVDHRQGEAWTAVRVLYAEGEQIQLNATSNEPIGIIGPGGSRR